MNDVFRITTLVQPLTNVGLAKLSEFSAFIPDDLTQALKEWGLGSFNLEVWLSNPEDYSVVDPCVNEFISNASSKGTNERQFILLATTGSGGKVYGSSASGGEVWATYDYESIEYCGLTFASALKWLLKDLTPTGFRMENLFFDSKANEHLCSRSELSRDLMSDIEGRLLMFEPDKVFSSLGGKCYLYMEREVIIILSNYDQLTEFGVEFVTSFNRRRVTRTPFWEFVNGRLNS